MSKQYVLNAQARELQGKGASRRLRNQGLVPAVIYGAGQDAQSISLRHNELIRNLQEEAFYSQIIVVDFGDRKEQVILRDLQKGASDNFLKDIKKCRKEIAKYSKENSHQNEKFTPKCFII